MPKHGLVDGKVWMYKAWCNYFWKSLNSKDYEVIEFNLINTLTSYTLYKLSERLVNVIKFYHSAFQGAVVVLSLLANHEIFTCPHFLTLQISTCPASVSLAKGNRASTRTSHWLYIFAKSAWWENITLKIGWMWKNENVWFIDSFIRNI